MALKRMGQTVGFLGDGINDAPALHAADVGISVDSAADVAKAAAEIILLEQDLGVVYEGVMEGRRTVVKTGKYILMASSANFGNIFSMVLAGLILPFLPLLPIQGHCHVWTAPADQGLFLALRRSWVRSCLRPFARRIESAGPDVVR
jgi:Mg2+-importing ATPase